MDALAWRRLARRCAAIDVIERRPREAAHDSVLGALGDLMDCREIAVRGDRKSRLYDVDAHLIEQLGDFELLLVRHRRAGTLLAVTQGRVENDDAILLGLSGGHELDPSSVRSKGAISDECAR